ncbi:phage portal protein, partial [Bacillus sp. mrc49]|uniref:phage portal protein n=1 Tax=Bacillus sp. mrc49 TaxID=2054913 RepID=UPI000CC0C337
MAFFQKLGIKATSNDPFLDALVSYTSNEGVSYTGIAAIKNSDVFTAVKILASDLATNPIELKENGLTIENNDLNYLLNVKPNDISTAFHFKFALAANMLLNGNSYARIIRDKKGQPLRLDFLAVSRMTGETNGHNIIYKYVSDNGETLELPQKDVLHFKYFTVDG